MNRIVHWWKPVIHRFPSVSKVGCCLQYCHHCFFGFISSIEKGKGLMFPHVYIKDRRVQSIFQGTHVSPWRGMCDNMRSMRDNINYLQFGGGGRHAKNLGAIIGSTKNCSRNSSNSQRWYILHRVVKMRLLNTFSL